MKQELIDDLKSLEGYLEHLESKYGCLGLPSWAQKKKPSKMQEAEMKRVSKRIREISDCKRHGGIEGLDCFMCKLEGNLNRRDEQ